jgi:hypothetical protein
MSPRHKHCVFGRDGAALIGRDRTLVLYRPPGSIKNTCSVSGGIIYGGGAALRPPYYTAAINVMSCKLMKPPHLCAASTKLTESKIQPHIMWRHHELVATLLVAEELCSPPHLCGHQLMTVCGGATITCGIYAAVIGPPHTDAATTSGSTSS